MKNGKLPRDARKRYGWNQTQLADYLGVTLGCVQSWEQERYPIHPCAIKLLNNLLTDSVDKVVDESSAA